VADNAHDLVEKLHREALERRRLEEEAQRRLVERMHAEALEDQRQKRQTQDELIDRLHREALDQAPQHPQPPAEPETVHHSQLPEAKPDSPLYHEWNTYRREVARLIAEGQFGRHVLIKGVQIVGIWDTHNEAARAGYQQFLGQPFLVHHIQEHERVLRCVTQRRCPNLRLPFRLAS
jgi:hypothetical protein